MKFFEFVYPKALFTILLDESVEQVENGLKYLAKEGRRDYLMMKYMGDCADAEFELTKGNFVDPFGRKERAYTFQGSFSKRKKQNGTVIPFVLTPSKLAVDLIALLLFITAFLIAISIIMESYFSTFLLVLIPALIYYQSWYGLKVSKVYQVQEFEEDLKRAIEKSSNESSNTKN